MFVRFIAACCIGMSVIELSSYWAEYHFRQVPVSIFFSALWIVLFLAGIVMLVKAKEVAQWIEDKLE